MKSAVNQLTAGGPHLAHDPACLLYHFAPSVRRLFGAASFFARTLIQLDRAAACAESWFLSRIGRGGRHQGGHQGADLTNDWLEQPMAVAYRSNERTPRAGEIDAHIGRRIRQRRVILGLTQQALADLIHVTYQQAHKYENGVNRVAAGRLYQIARALDVDDINYFFEGLYAIDLPPNASERKQLDLGRDYRTIRKEKHRDAVSLIARILAEAERGDAAAEAA